MWEYRRSWLCRWSEPPRMNLSKDRIYQANHLNKVLLGLDINFTHVYYSYQQGRDSLYGFLWWDNICHPRVDIINPVNRNFLHFIFIHRQMRM
jgi:hypothetical protein